jgi:hypothetical protein
MTMARLWIVLIAGLIPWGVVAIVTNWFNELQSDGTRTLSVGHAIGLMGAQMLLSFVTYFILDRWWS